ncbi:hypothetical protein ABQF35_15110 [Mycobacterium syngnathidarum]
MTLSLWSLLGKQHFGLHGSALFLTIAVIIMLAALLASGSLLISQSSRAHGLALSVTGSSAVVLLGGMVYGFWIIGW